MFIRSDVSVCLWFFYRWCPLSDIEFSYSITVNFPHPFSPMFRSFFSRWTIFARCFVRHHFTLSICVNIPYPNVFVKSSPSCSSFIYSAYSSYFFLGDWTHVIGEIRSRVWTETIPNISAIHPLKLIVLKQKSWNKDWVTASNCVHKSCRYLWENKWFQSYIWKIWRNEFSVVCEYHITVVLVYQSSARRSAAGYFRSVVHFRWNVHFWYSVHFR